MTLKLKMVLGGVVISLGVCSWLISTDKPNANLNPLHEQAETSQINSITDQDRTQHQTQTASTGEHEDNFKERNESTNTAIDEAEKLKTLIANYRGPALNVDVNGNLIVDNALKFYLEHLTHWLGLEGAAKEDVYRLSLEQLQRQYSGDLLTQVTDQFERFWQYNSELNSLMSEDDIAAAKAEFDGTYEREDTVGLLSHYQNLRGDLRNRHFNSNEVEAYFGDENRYDQFYKQSLIDGHSRNAEQLLTESQREYRKQSHILVDLKSLEKESNATSGSQSWKDQVRNKYDTETADKIILAQTKKSAWKDKKNEYLLRKEALAGQTSLSADDLGHELDRIMREELAFSEFEVRRIQALEGRFQQKI